ncbi:MAG: 23S rRNA (guanosine(2251)-2'-O)-methyltransferase RlmB [Rhodospirillaceae bacterium]
MTKHKTRKRGAPDRRPPRQKDSPADLWIYGHHAVAAALANPERRILRLAATLDAAAKLESDAAVPREALKHIGAPARRSDIDALLGEGAVHQGVAVLTRPLAYALEGVVEQLAAKPDACVVVLDRVTDPHNTGAILRSAAAFGAGAVIAPDRHAPEETGAMAKAASGALDRVRYVKTVNLVRALEQLKAAGFWLVGLAADTDAPLSSVDLSGRIALVLGAEGEGLRRLVREHCDHMAVLPMSGEMESLNVSNAAAVALYEKARQSSREKS